MPSREALEREHLAQRRVRGDREAVRVLLITRRGAMRARKAINHLKALVVTAREELRHQLRNAPTDELVSKIVTIAPPGHHSRRWHVGRSCEWRSSSGGLSRR